MSAREAILKRLRQASSDLPQWDISRHIRPQLDGDLLDVFKAKVISTAATLAELPSMAQVPEAVAEYYRQHAGQGELAVAPALRELPWPQDLPIGFGTCDGKQILGVSDSFCAMAETGTLVLLSSADNPTGLNFLPDYHIVVVRRDRVVAHQEDIWQLLRTEQDAVPRTVNMITGPSRTADVEQTIQLGAHGPRSLHVLLVD